MSSWPWQSITIRKALAWLPGRSRDSENDRKIHINGEVVLGHEGSS